MKIKCVNIKCQGCVDRIRNALLDKCQKVEVDIKNQIVEVDVSDESVNEVKSKLRQLGFLQPDSIFGKIKGFFSK